MKYTVKSPEYDEQRKQPKKDEYWGAFHEINSDECNYRILVRETGDGGGLVLAQKIADLLNGVEHEQAATN